MNYSQIAVGRRRVSPRTPPFFLGNQQFEIEFGYRVVYLCYQNMFPFPTEPMETDIGYGL
jgi:hypothetical protein